MSDGMTPNPPSDSARSRADAARSTTAADRTAAPGRTAPGGGINRWAPARRWVVPLGIAAGLAAGVGYGVVAPARYEATGYVLVVPRQAADSATALGFAQAYGRVVTGSAVLAGAQAATHTAAGELRSRVSAQTSPDAPMIAVTGSGSRPRSAAAVANAVARSLAATGNRDAASTGVRLLVFSPAAVPTAPSSPSPALAGAVGASAGGLLGALVLLVRPRERYERPGPYGPAAGVPAQEPAEAGV